MAQGICDAVRGREIIHAKSSANEFLTISIGAVCCVADDALNDELLISYADNMLYKAKEEGRDCFVISNDVSEATTQVIQETKAEKLSA